MTQRPSKEALRLHQQACEAREFGYTDPDSGLFVMTSFYLRERGYCCGSGCRHCPFSEDERWEAGRPDEDAWPWPAGED